MIPAEMRERRAWVLWRFEERDGKATKVPYQAIAPSLRASSTDPATWAAFGVAVAALERSRHMDGIGFVLSPDDPFVALDLDHCIDENGELSADAAAVVDEVDSYTEITPSGHGLRIIARGDLPPGGRKRGNFEVYDSGRYVTITGRVYAGRGEIRERAEQIAALHARVFPPVQSQPQHFPRHTPRTDDLPLADQEILRKASSATNGLGFNALWHGYWQEAGYSSQSEADMALCCHLAWWADRDEAQVDRLFRESRLMRDKWDESHYSGGVTYGHNTVARACELVEEGYRQGIAVPLPSRNGNGSASADFSVFSVFNGSEGPKNRVAPPSNKEEDQQNQYLRTFQSAENAENAANDTAEQESASCGIDVEPWPAILPLGEYDLPPFPLESLPSWLATFACATSEAMQVAPDLPAMMALSALAASVSRKYEVSARPGWREPLNVYTATVLAPGNRKSAVASAITKPLLEWERAEAVTLADERARAASQKRILEARQKDAERRAATAKVEERTYLESEARDIAAEADAARERGEFRLFVEDCTPERLTGLLADNDGRIAILSAEGDAFDLIAGRYSDKANLGVYLKGHTGETLIVDRIGRRGERVEHPALTIGVAIQPEVLRGLLQKPNLRGRGLLGRFLYSLPDDRLGFRDADPAPIPDAVSEAYAEGMHTLLSLPLRKGGEGGEVLPFILALSSDARALLTEYQREIEKELRPGAMLGDMTDWGGKAVGAVVRIAALLHLADAALPAREESFEIESSTFLAAVQIGSYLCAHARAAFSEMGADSVMDDARYILAWIERRGEMQFRQGDLHRALARRFRKSEDMVPALSLLVARNYLREYLPSAEERKHNAKSRFDVNPAFFSRPSRGRSGSGSTF